MRGTYLYAIMAGEPHLNIGPIGLPDGMAEVVAMPVEGFTAVTSEYQGPALEELSRAGLLNALVIHQRVIEQAMAERSLLPVKFGTILASPEEVRKTLVRYRSRLAEALADVGDAVEVDLSATWDVDAMLADVARDPSIEALAATANESADEALAARVRVGKLVAEALERRRDDYRHRVVTDLVPLARDAQPNPLPSEDLVFNLAFLVERPDLPGFEATVDRLGDELGDRLAFRYVGPLPPHSFATVELMRPDPAEIESARVLLGLDEWFSQAELRRKYRDLAVRYHPDHNRSDPSAQERFAALAAAHETLTRYLRGQQETEMGLDEDGRYDLAPDEVTATLLLEIRRADIEPSPAGQAIYESDAVL